jgi:hypothetical protein
MYLPPPMPPLSDVERRRLRELLYWLDLAAAAVCLTALALLAWGRAESWWGDWSLTASACLLAPLAYLLLQALLLAPESWQWLE